MRCGDSQARAGGHHHHQAGLAAILGGRRAFDDFHRLHGVDRELIGEDLALLVRNRLAVDGERVRGVIAESVKKAVGVGRNSRGGERHQRTERRGLAFERQLVEKLPIHVRVSGCIGLHQIARCCHCHAFSRRADRHGDLGFNRQRRTHVDILFAALESFRRGAQVIVVVRNVIEFEVSLCVGLDALVIVGNGVLDFHGRAHDGRSGGVQHRSADRSGVGAARLRIGRDRRREAEYKKNQRDCETAHSHIFRL